MPATIVPIDQMSAFIVGTLGAFLGYILLYRETRLADFAQNPSKNWRVLLFDMVVYLLCGGLVTCFMVVPNTPKEAFIGGLAWQSIAGGVVAGTELATYKKAAASKEGKV